MKREIERFLHTEWAGRNLIYLEETDSTNLRAMQFGAEGAAHGTLIVTSKQSQGKGRRGRNWESPAGKNIYMSLLLRPEFLAVQAPMLTLLMAYSVAEALKDCEQIEVQIKWPNDLILNKKKICGILTEMSMREMDIDYVVIGVGINVNMEKIPQELEKSATSLRIETGRELFREALIAGIMNKFEQNYRKFCEAGDLSPIQDGYNRILVNIGKEVRILEPGKEYNAKAHGIDRLGELQVEREDGRRESIFAGEVSVRGIYGYV